MIMPVFKIMQLVLESNAISFGISRIFSGGPYCQQVLKNGTITLERV